MAHRIDADNDPDGGQTAVAMLRRGAAPSEPRARPATHPHPARPAPEEPPAARKPLWDKNNFGFWLAVCILLSLAFSIVWHAIG